MIGRLVYCTVFRYRGPLGLSAESRVRAGGLPAELGPRLRVRVPLSPFLSPYSCSPLLSRVVQVAQPRWAGHRALIAPRSLALRELFLCDPLRRTTDSPLGSFDARPRVSPFSLSVSFLLVLVCVVAHVVPTRAPSLALRADLRSSVCRAALAVLTRASLRRARRPSLFRFRCFRCPPHAPWVSELPGFVSLVWLLRTRGSHACFASALRASLCFSLLCFGCVVCVLCVVVSVW